VTSWDTVLTARLLVMQSKRRLLASTERRLRKHNLKALREKDNRLHKELEDAQRDYQATLIAWGSPAMPDYWPTAYTRMIGLADRLANQLKRAAVEGSPARRYELGAEIEILEELSRRWRESLRAAITNGAA
jgi:hypothetical protein